MPPSILVDSELLTDAAMFAGVTVLISALSLLVPRERRHALLPMGVVAVVMMAGLWALDRYGMRLGSGALYEVVREALLALLAVAVIYAVITYVTRVLLGRMRIPQILLDVLLALSLIAYGIYRLNAVGVNLAGVVTTSAVITGALAFSAGETLGNLWAGVSLQLENTLRIGDWVRVEEKIGQVTSIRWRSMSIATAANETIVIPNSMLMKDRVTVVGRSGDASVPFRRDLPFEVEYAHSPAKVVRAITAALSSAEIANVARDPAAFCVCDSFQDSGIRYHAVYHITDVGLLKTTDSDVLVCVFAALEREDMTIPFPHRVIQLDRSTKALAASARQLARIQAVERSELFGVLIADERAAVAADLKRCPYAAGDVIFRKGEPADSLYLLAEGRVRIVDDDGSGRRTQLAELAAPGYFGEMGLLTGQPRGATAIAADDALCYRLDKAGFDSVLKARHEIVDALAQVVARRNAENDTTLRSSDADARARHALKGAREMVRRIRQFFSLPVPPV